MKTLLYITLVLVSFQTLARDTYIYKVHPDGTRTKEYVYKDRTYKNPISKRERSSVARDTYIYKIHPNGTRTKEFVYKDRTYHNPIPSRDRSSVDTLYMDDDTFYME